MSSWKCALTLDRERKVVGGNPAGLRDAIRHAADLRVYTEFRNDEHIDAGSENAEWIQEVAEFRVTYLVDDRWAAGIMLLRPHVTLLPPDGLGPRPAWSFFLYNENGQQGDARLYFDGQPAIVGIPPTSYNPFSAMGKYHQQGSFDIGHAWARNFIYDFEVFRFLVRDDWHEVYSHTPAGEPLAGSLDRLIAAFVGGCQVKVGIRNLCADLAGEREAAIEHELFVELGSGYNFTAGRLFSAATHPLMRVRPAIPMLYGDEGWDFGWLFVSTDGRAAQWRCAPQTLVFEKSEARYAIRWFVR